MKAIITTALIFAATAAPAYTTTNCTTFGGAVTCTTVGGGTYTTTRCTTFAGVVRCSSY